jgi:pimeloyl-ACP methyl ester carboxylesterase
MCGVPFVTHTEGLMTASTGRSEPTNGAVRSADGTEIGFYQVGQGPGVILLHGAGQTSANLSTLARGLSDAFTVYVPDRRGRSRSGPYADVHGLSTEIEDLTALLDATGSRRVFGLSAGAVIAIETALSRPQIARLALYEPPLSFNAVRHGTWVPRYERELRAGKLGSALVTVLKGTADRTAFRYVPRFLLAGALNLAISRTAGRPVPDGQFSPRDLIPTLHYDAITVRDAAGPLERFAHLGCELLLLGGSRSAANLKASLDGLSSVLPGAKRVTLQGAGHTAADNSRQPARVSAELRVFFQ